MDCGQRSTQGSQPAWEKKDFMTEEKTDESCEDCEPTFAAFLRDMAEHNKEQVAEFSGKVICPTCGKVHQYPPPASNSTFVTAS